MAYVFLFFFQTGINLVPIKKTLVVAKLGLTLSRIAGPVGPPAGLVGPLFDIAFEIHFDEVGMFFFEI